MAPVTALYRIGSFSAMPDMPQHLSIRQRFPVFMFPERRQPTTYCFRIIRTSLDPHGWR